MQAMLEDAAFAIATVGTVSAPFKDVNGWHVLRLVSKNEARDQSFADVERTIRVRVLQEKRIAREKALIEETKKALKIEIDETTLAAIAADLALPPAVSGSTTAAPLPSTSASTSASASASAKKP